MYEKLFNTLFASIFWFYFFEPGVPLSWNWPLPFVFIMFLPSLLHSRHASLSRYRRWSNKMPNLKIYRWFCSHCLQKTAPLRMQLWLMRLTSLLQVPLMTFNLNVLPLSKFPNFEKQCINHCASNTFIWNVLLVYWHCASSMFAHWKCATLQSSICWKWILPCLVSTHPVPFCAWWMGHYAANIWYWEANFWDKKLIQLN